MRHKNPNRRQFLQDVTKVSGLMMLAPVAADFTEVGPSRMETPQIPAGKIKFAVININHPHIYGMTEAIKRGGGELVALYAKEADLSAAF